jgi:hypothetical protein
MPVVTNSNLINYANAKNGNLEVGKYSGGGKQAIDYLGREGPISKHDVETFKNVFDDKVRENLGPGESKDDLEILSLLAKLEKGGNFDYVASLDGQPGLSAADLLASPDPSWGGEKFQEGGPEFVPPDVI